MWKNGNNVVLARRVTKLPRRKSLNLESRNQIADLELLRSEAFVVNYQKAEDVESC